MKTIHSILIIICLALSAQSNAQTFRYFDVQTLKHTALLIPKNHVLLPIQPRNEYNMYGIKNQTGLTSEYKECCLNKRRIFQPIQG